MNNRSRLEQRSVIRSAPTGMTQNTTLKMWITVSLVLILVFPSFATVVQYQIGGNLLRFAPMLLGSAFLILAFMKMGMKLSIGWGNEIIAWCALLAISLYRNKDISAGANIGDIGIFTVVVLLIPFLKCRTDWIEPFFRVFALFMSIHLGVTLLCYVFPIVYDRVIAPFMHFQKYYANGYMRGLCENHGSNAYYITSAFMIFLAKALTSGKKHWVFACILAFIGILLTVKRGVLLFGAVTAAIAHLIVFHRKKGAWKRTAILALGIGALYLLISWFAPEMLRVFERFEAEAQEDISSGRFTMYAYALTLFLQHPLLGVGWGGFKYEYMAHIGIQAPSGYNTHDIYLQLLCEAGILGCTIFGVLAGYTLKTTIKMIWIWRDGEDEKNLGCEKWCIVASMAYQIFFLLYGLTGNTLYEKELFTPYLLACAAIYSAVAHKRAVIIKTKKHSCIKLKNG